MKVDAFLKQQKERIGYRPRMVLSMLELRLYLSEQQVLEDNWTSRAIAEAHREKRYKS